MRLDSLVHLENVEAIVVAILTEVTGQINKNILLGGIDIGIA